MRESADRPHREGRHASEVELEPRLVGTIEGAFLVKSYQRGYRWGELEVSKLLDDLYENRGQNYYLQPVVVKQLDDKRWELVDGQQRLTTLFLVLNYMLERNLQSTGPTFTLEYETRPGSAEFLASPSKELSHENIDFFHMNQAYECIDAWFEAHGIQKQAVANQLQIALFDTVYVIWYRAPDDVDARKLFARLNVGRIPLSDAELVKALLLSAIEHTDGVPDRSREIAAQWDGIERDLARPETWAFAAGASPANATRIALLLNTLAEQEQGSAWHLPPRPFQTFDALRESIQTDPIELWERVVSLHGQVLGWYEDRAVFHKCGYLTAQGRRLKDLVELAKGRRKSEFTQALDQAIREDLALTEDQVRNLGYKDDRKAQAVLLLMNAETVTSLRDSSERFSFAQFAERDWSIEHIHAQNAEELKTTDAWREWLRCHLAALDDLPNVTSSQRDEMQTRITDSLEDIKKERFLVLEQEISPLFVSPDDEDGSEIDSIANLALLQGGDNTALSNSAFDVKRRELLKRDRKGSYIPACTRNVFLKYYSEPNAQQIYYWGRDDRQAYLDDMIETVRPYLMPSDTETVEP